VRRDVRDGPERSAALERGITLTDAEVAELVSFLMTLGADRSTVAARP
jgi:hypothetical protein